MPLFAAQSRHEKPYPPISKIKCRLDFGRQDGNSMPHSPAQRKRDFGNLKFCARGAELDERRETRAETRRRETMRQCGFANISSSHVSARLSSIVSRPRAHAYSASGDHVRGTSHIAIGEMAGIWREIMVRNVVFGGIAARPEGSPHPARRDASPHHWLPLRRSRGDRRAVRNSGARGARALPFCRDKRGLSRCWPGHYDRGIFEPQRGEL